jgi:hypothetical protein
MKDQMEVCSLSRGIILPLIGSVPIRSITERPSLSPSSFARNSFGSPCGLLSHLGELRVYHVPSEQQSAVGLAFTPVIQRLRP